LRISRSLAIGILCLSLLSVRASAAQQNCDDVRTKKGEAAYQKCRYDEQEKTIKNQVTTYADAIKQQKQVVKYNYTALINQENSAWESAQIQQKAAVADRKAHIKFLEQNKEQNAVQIQQEKNSLAMFQKIIGLLQKTHTQQVKRLKIRQDGELLELDALVTNYELQLRQNAPTSF